jgi:mRNA interferase MazF
LRFAYTLRVEPSAMNGLTVPSVLLVFQLRAIDQQRILGTLGRLEQTYLDQLDLEMKRLLGLR